MQLDKLSPGKNAPNEFNVVIEIPQGSGAIKYEVDKDSGALLVDRFLGTSMVYPANYGFIPGTLGDDGDPLDVMVITNTPVVPGAVIEARAIGVLKMEDESGMDEKVIAVPKTKLTPFYKDVQSVWDLPEITCKQIEHFFTRYKDLEEGKWVKIMGWGNVEDAKAMVVKSIEQVNKAA